MNSTFLAALSSTLMIFIFVISGYILRKTKSIPEESSFVISSLLMNFFVPIMMICVITRYLTVETIIEGYPILLISFGTILVTYLISIPVSGLMTKKTARRNVFIFSLVFSNFGYMGFPVIEAIYGREHFLYLTLFTIPYYLTVNVLGDYIIREEKKLNYKTLVNPITIGIIIGFIIVILKVPVNSFISSWLDMVYNCVTPVSMLLAGIVLGSKPLKSMFVNRQIYMLSLFRLLILPLLLLWILYIFGFRGVSLGIPVLIVGMPIAVNGVMLAESLDGDSFVAAQGAFISTFISIISIPVLTQIILMLG